MHCYLCFASAPPRVAPHAAGWETYLLSAVCPDCLDRAMGTPEARPLTAFGGAPFGALPVVYHQFVPRDMVLLYGGRYAGQSAVVYRDAYAHWEHRWRMAMRSRLAEIDAGFDAIQVATHRHLDALARETEAKIDANTVHYHCERDEDGRLRWSERRHGSIVWYSYPVM
jgi:hypothetical protein